MCLSQSSGKGSNNGRGLGNIAMDVGAEAGKDEMVMEVLSVPVINIF